MVDIRKYLKENKEKPILKNEKVSERIFTPPEEDYTVAGIMDMMIQAAGIITEHKIAIALGYESNWNVPYYNGAEIDWIMKHVTPILKAAQETKKITAQNATKVIELLGKGKLTPTEAMQYLQIIEKKETLDLIESLK